MNTILSVENLRTTFSTKAGPVTPVAGVSYSIPAKKTLGVVGESGCGKTVTSFSILRLIPGTGKIESGKVLFQGRDITHVPDHEMRKIRGREIAMIFQEPMTALNPVLTIGFQISEQLLTHFDMSKADARHESIRLLEKVGIPSPESRVDNYPHQLSGGMRQRAMIAMAISCKPKLLIADEPTTALDVTIQAQILDLLQQLQDESGMAMQFITHDLGVISEVADEVLVMYAGKVVEHGPAEILFQDPRHPYTKGLINSIPRIDQTKTKLDTIPGSVPALNRLPQGCRFQNRCPYVQSKCRSSEPELIQIGGSEENRQVACFYPINN